MPSSHLSPPRWGPDALTSPLVHTPNTAPNVLHVHVIRGVTVIFNSVATAKAGITLKLIKGKIFHVPPTPLCVAACRWVGS